MIKAMYHRGRQRLTVDGHAQSGEPGHDLVCASASILAYTFVSCVRNAVEAGMAKQDVMEREEGHMCVACRPAGKWRGVVTAQLDAICGGFELLARSYPQYITYEMLR